MSTALETSRPPSEAIFMYWRSHGPDGRLPVREQSWWFRVQDEAGGITNHEYIPSEPFAIYGVAEAVVDVGEMLGLCFDVSQVIVNTVNRTGEWYVEA